jgi:DNA gyrase/topoisomerase IV subunit A
MTLIVQMLVTCVTFLEISSCNHIAIETKSILQDESLANNFIELEFDESQEKLSFEENDTEQEEEDDDDLDENNFIIQDDMWLTPEQAKWFDSNSSKSDRTGIILKKNQWPKVGEYVRVPYVIIKKYYSTFLTFNQNIKVNTNFFILILRR